MSDKLRVPKVMERVVAAGHMTVYAVIAVHEEAKTVNLKLVGREGPPLKDVPWSILQYIDPQEIG